MNGLNALKEEVVSLIGAPCMVQRDRTGRALFFSDYIRRGIAGADGRLKAAGFAPEAENGCAHIGLTQEKGARFLGSLPEKALPPMDEANALAVFCCQALDLHAGRSGMPAARTLQRALLLWDAGQTTALALLLHKELAIALRNKSPVPVALGRLLLDLL